jgi:hypothetical protein
MVPSFVVQEGKNGQGAGWLGNAVELLKNMELD